jgi:hypothetical protein
MPELIEGHIRFHVLAPNGRKNAPQAEAGIHCFYQIRCYSAWDGRPPRYEELCALFPLF